MTEYDKAKWIRNCLLITVADILLYKDSWGADFCLKNTVDTEERLRKRLKENSGESSVDVSRLSKEQMLDLGFRPWEKGSELFLIPVWLYPFLPENITTEDISGNVLQSKSEMDNDHRMGVLAHGVYPCGVMRKTQTLKE